MTSLRWGIIGPGKIAHDFAHDLSLVQPYQKAVAVLGIDKKSTGDFAKKYSICSVYTNLEEFVGDKELNVVYIATPHPEHYEQAMACLKNNIPVLCEKPLTLNAEQSAELVQASRDNNCFLMEAMWIRFLPGIAKVLDLIKSDAIGKVVSIKASMGFKAPADARSRYFNPDLGGGSLMDLGVYTVFLAQLILEQPKTVKAIGTLTDEGIDESCSILLDYEGSAQALLDATLISQSNQPAEIAGEKGIIRIQHPWFEKSPGVELQLYNQDIQTIKTEWEGHGLQFEILEVLHCLDNNQIESERYPHSFSKAISGTMDAIRDQIHVKYKDDK